MSSVIIQQQVECRKHRDCGWNLCTECFLAIATVTYTVKHQLSICTVDLWIMKYYCQHITGYSYLNSTVSNLGINEQKTCHHMNYRRLITKYYGEQMSK